MQSARKGCASKSINAPADNLPLCQQLIAHRPGEAAEVTCPLLFGYQPHAYGHLRVAPCCQLRMEVLLQVQSYGAGHVLIIPIASQQLEEVLCGEAGLVSWGLLCLLLHSVPCSLFQDCLADSWLIGIIELLSGAGRSLPPWLVDCALGVALALVVLELEVLVVALDHRGLCVLEQHHERCVEGAPCLDKRGAMAVHMPLYWFLPGHAQLLSW